MDRLELTGVADMRAGDLSHGDKKRLDIAIALATQPQILLLDEPVAGMSKDEARKTEALIRKLSTEMTVLVIEHDMEMVMGISDTITVLHQGRSWRPGRRPRFAPIRASKRPTSAATPQRRSRTDEPRPSPVSATRLQVDASTPTTARATCCATSRSRSAPARPSRCSAATASARRRRSRSIVGWIKPRTGSVTLDGEELVGRDMMSIARAGVSLVPEERRIFTNLTVAENLQDRAGHRAPSRLDARPRLREVPAPARAATHKGDEISGGEKQMLAIARALLQDVKVLLLDEPTEGLAPLIVREVENVIREIKAAGITTLLVEQNLYSALAVADRCYIIDQGEIKFEGTPEAGARRRGAAAALPARLKRRRPMDEDLSPAEQMVHELALDPALEIDDNPLLDQARRNVADTVERAHERAREHPPKDDV